MDNRTYPGSGDDGGFDTENSEREARRDYLRAEVKRGLEDIEENRVVDLEAAFERIEAMLDELEAAKRG